MYTSLAATSETLRQFIEDAMTSEAGLASFFPGANYVVSLTAPKDMQGQQKGLSVWLYRVVRDESRLNDPPTIRPLPSGEVEIVPPPLPLRLHYLMTPLTENAPDTAQRILGRVLQIFHRQPVLSGALLRSDLAGSDAEIHVHLETLTLEEIARVWDAIEGPYQLSVSYEVTLAYIASDALPLRSSLVESVRADAATIVERHA
jgi:hypothetical protein